MKATVKCVPSAGWKKVFVGVFTFGICVLFFSCVSSPGNAVSTGNQVSEKPNSYTSGGNNSKDNSGSNNDSNSGGTRVSITQSAPNRKNEPDDIYWDISALDTAAKADYLSPDEKDVILEMNKVRADPKKYAELYIKPMLQYNWGGPFGDKSYLPPGETVYRSTDEGRNGIQSCIDDLSKRQGMPPLFPEKGLFLAARDHVNDTGPKGIIGHTGGDGSSMGQRIDRHGKWDRGAGENISYGHNKGRDIVVQLLIDDGVSNRGHRNNILNKDFKYAGAAIGRHSRYEYLCVIDYANEYTSK